MQTSTRLLRPVLCLLLPLAAALSVAAKAPSLADFQALAAKTNSSLTLPVYPVTPAEIKALAENAIKTANAELDALAAPRGVSFIDAPVSGTKKPAEDGALVILAGGPRDKVEALEPVFLAMGKKVVYCGAAGQGSMMKMFINLLLGVMMEGFAEALNFGKLGGLDMDAMLETAFSGAMNSPMFQVKAPLIKENNYPASFPLKHLAKDCKFVVDTAFELGAPVPVAVRGVGYRLDA